MAMEIDAVPPSILVIEADPLAAAELRGMLEEAGLSVRVAPTFADSMVALLGEPIDVVLSDVSLPDASGFEVLATIRTITTDIPVLLMTAAPRPVDRLRAAGAGAAGYLTRPITSADLVSAIWNALVGEPTGEW